MRWKITLRLIGFIVCFVALAQLLSALVSLYYQDGMFIAFLQSLVVTAVPGLFLLRFFGLENQVAMNHKHAIFFVALGWLSACLFGSLPYAFSADFSHFTDCLFESVSGFTTTGASVVNNIQTLPPSLLFWRSLTQWLGGMGIILFSLAVLPFLNLGGMQIYKNAVPGHTSDKLRPRIRDTAKFLWITYLSLTVTQIVLLLLGDIEFFKAVCHTFGTVSTGGFNTHEESIRAFSSVYLEIVTIVFMYLSAINFALHFRLFKTGIKGYLASLEFRFFTFALLISTLVISLYIWGDIYPSYLQALRQATFQTVSVLSTTGYVGSNYQLWGALPLFILLLCVVSGGMAGSSSGGLKAMRIVLLAKMAIRELKKLVHPKAVFLIKIEEKVISEEVLRGVYSFVLLYCGLIFCMTLVLSSIDMELLTSLGSVVACTSNLGPGLGETAAWDNYAHLPVLGKWILALCMFLGRLEIYTVLIFLFPAFWKQ